MDVSQLNLIMPWNDPSILKEITPLRERIFKDIAKECYEIHNLQLLTDLDSQ